jgi:hypothetical protein
MLTWISGILAMQLEKSTNREVDEEEEAVLNPNIDRDSVRRLVTAHNVR